MDNRNLPLSEFSRELKLKGFIAYAISQPDDVDINEILYRPTKQEY